MWTNVLQGMQESSSLEVEWPSGIEEDCVLLHGFLSPAECDALIAKTEHAGFASASPDYPPSYRNNDRLVMDDPMLAEALFQRLMRCAGELAAVEAFIAKPGGAALAVNERMRFCRYRPGTQFGAHQDGVRHDEATQSRLTFMVYLNGGSFTGGDTVFYAHRADAMAGQNPIVRLQPRRGSLILFNHALWHAGACVDAGVKYVMRSDLMYASDDRRNAAGPFEPSHRGYVWSLTALSEQRVASAGRDAIIRIWDRQGALETALVGHTQSVLGVLEVGPEELISYSRDRTVRCWRTETGASQIIGTLETAVLSAVLLESGRLVTGEAAGKLTVWDLAANTSTNWEAHESWIWSIAATGSNRFATAAEDGWVRLWCSVDYKPIAEIDLGLPLRSVTYSHPNGSCLAVGDIEGRLHILDIEGGLTRLSSIKAHEGPVRKLRFEDDRTVLSCGEDGQVCRWHLPSGSQMVIATHENFASDVLYIGDGRWLSCGYDSQIRIGMLSQGDGNAGEVSGR